MRKNLPLHRLNHTVVRCMLAALSVVLLQAPITLKDKNTRQRVMIFRPPQKDFDEPIRTMLEEWHHESHFLVEQVTIKNRTGVADVRKVLNRFNPHGLVLMGNISLLRYEEYQKASRGAAFPPAVAAMAAYVREQIKDLQNATGITYEAQAVSALPTLRNLVQGDLKRVGVVYSSNLRRFFQQQKQSAMGEEIALVGRSIEAGTRRVDRQIMTALKALIEEEQVDAVWVLNDMAVESKR